jgi:putative ABC transport system substrate-binding protein
MSRRPLRLFAIFVLSAVLLPFAAVPDRAQAQSGKVYRIAFVSPANPLAWMTETGVPYYRALLQELRRLGYVEGQNLIVERYSGEGKVERYADLVRDALLPGSSASLR